MRVNPVCPYCGKLTKLVRCEQVYGEEVARKQRIWNEVMYSCDPCKATVGCHRGTSTPLGTPANRKLRALRRHVHVVFDARWQSGPVKSRKKSRSRAYKWLAAQMGLTSEECHIGLFDERQCLKVLELCNADGI